MQVKELESNGLKKSFEVTVDAAVINKQTEAELKNAGEKIKIPGFRPGNIPMKVLQQRYGKSVQADVLKQVITKTSNDMLAEKKLRPSLTPQVAIKEYKDDGDLTYTVSFEALPDVPSMNFEQIKLDRNTFDVSEADLDKAMGTIAERSPSLSRAKDGSKAALGNTVLIDFKGMIDGVAFDGGTAEKFKLELGSGQFIAGFEDQLVGAKEGDEKDVKVQFPAEYGAKNLAGKDAVFEVKVHEILVPEAPVIDDEFAKARGFTDAAGLREAVRMQMNNEYGQLVRNQLKKTLFDALDEKYDFELPQSLIDFEFKTIWERVEQAKSEEDADKSDAELKEEYMEISKRRVKLGLILADIGTRNKIQISREEMARAVMQQASQYPGQERQVMEFYRNNPERADDLRGPILEEKAVDIILGQVKYNDKKVTIDALVSADEDAETPKKKKAKAKADESEEAVKPKKKASGK